MFMGMIRHSQGVLILSADISRGGERLGWKGRREGREGARVGGRKEGAVRPGVESGGGVAGAAAAWDNLTETT